MGEPPKNRFLIRKAKIYTRAGDRGETSLISGKRIRKDHPRVAAYGTVDELNAALGTAVSFIRERKIVQLLQGIQNELFNIGAELASPRKLKKAGQERGFYQLNQSKVKDLESLADQYDATLPQLKTFILPSGTSGASFLHLTRTVCRRAEREVVALAKKDKINPNIIAYLNRLSDLLFVLARYLNKKAGRKEVFWKKD